MSDDVMDTQRKLKDMLLWESFLGSDDRHKPLFDPGNAIGTSCVTGGNHDYEVLSSERLAKLNAQFAAMRSGKAYLVCPPEFANALVDFPTVQFESPKVDGIQFRVYQDFGVKLMPSRLDIVRSMVNTTCGGGGSDPVYVPRPAVVEPESPSMFQWCIVVVVLSGLLCAMAGAL